jgi:aminomethyltransferase
MVPFAGWEMPVQYAGILEEHRAVRGAAGLFDISHMGQVEVAGALAADWLERVLTNRVARLAEGEGHYTFLLNDRGGVIDDLILYRTGPETFLLVVNAARADEDLGWLSSHLPGTGVTLGALEGRAALALQGPLAPAILADALGPEHPQPARNRIARLDGTWVARTGYTGEDGFEIFLPATEVEAVWGRLLELGGGAGLKPCGLGARDTLRLEMGYPLNGSDLSPERTPLEAGLGGFVDLRKGEFIGRDVLAQQESRGLPSRLAAIRLDAPGPPPRPHYGVIHEGEVVGELCSGTLSPSLGIGVGLAYLPPLLAEPGTELEIDIRGKAHSARVVRRPFYARPAEAS